MDHLRHVVRGNRTIRRGRGEVGNQAVRLAHPAHLQTFALEIQEKS